LHDNPNMYFFILLKENVSIKRKEMRDFR
jgi:hypothetical protein